MRQVALDWALGHARGWIFRRLFLEALVLEALHKDRVQARASESQAVWAAIWDPVVCRVAMDSHRGLLKMQAHRMRARPPTPDRAWAGVMRWPDKLAKGNPVPVPRTVRASCRVLLGPVALRKARAHP